MLLVTDTNILLRCSLGNALWRARDLRQRDIRLSTTDRNIGEAYKVLVGKFGVEEEEAMSEVEGLLDVFELIPGDAYEHFAERALERLRQGGKSDWPALAAAMAFDGAIWSQDVDYFGVGVPIWSTDNTKFVTANERGQTGAH